MSIPKELEPLAQEARKYKSAEEFMNKIIKGTTTARGKNLAISQGERVLQEGGFRGSLQDFYTQATKGVKLPTTMALPRITQPFGVKNPKVEKFSRGGINRGVDLATKTGTPLYVPEGSWKVANVFSGAKKRGYIGNRENGGYGNSVLLVNTQTGEKLRMSHLSQVGVKSGQVISSGQLVAKSGWTGNSSGPHLDLEYYKSNGKLADATRTKYVKDIFNQVAT